MMLRPFWAQEAYDLVGSCLGSALTSSAMDSEWIPNGFWIPNRFQYIMIYYIICIEPPIPVLDCDLLPLGTTWICSHQNVVNAVMQ